MFILFSVWALFEHTKFPNWVLRTNVWVFNVYIVRLTSIYLLHIFHSSVDRLDGKKDSICLPEKQRPPISIRLFCALDLFINWKWIVVFIFFRTTLNFVCPKSSIKNQLYNGLQFWVVCLFLWRYLFLLLLLWRYFTNNAIEEIMKKWRTNIPYSKGQNHLIHLHPSKTKISIHT